MPGTTQVTINVAGLPQYEAAVRELAALREAIARHRNDAAETLKGIEAGTVQADEEGHARARIEADVWDEVAALPGMGNAAA